VDLAHLLRDLGEDLVVCLADHVAVFDPVVVQESLADVDVSEVGVEHGDRAGVVLDDLLE
jgi:hypothetical protein